MKKIVVILVLSTLGVFVSGCTQSPGTDTMGSDNQGSTTIKVGVIAPLSGPAAGYGQDVLHGYQYVVDMVNADGGIDGKQVELIVEDGRCNGKDAVTAVQKLINVDKVEVIAGGACSSETLAAGPIAQQAGVVMVSATATSPDISNLGDYIFRYYNDTDTAITMLDYLAQKNISNIALVYENTDYAVAFSDIIRTDFSGNISVDQKYSSDEKDFGPIAKNIANDPLIEYVVLIPQTSTSAVVFVKSLQAEDIREGKFQKSLLSSETIFSQETTDSLGNGSNGIKSVKIPEAESLGDENTQQFVSDLVAGYEVQYSDVFVLFAADSMGLLLEAVQKVGYDGDAVKTYITQFDSETNKRKTYFGDMYFDAEGDGQGIPFGVLEIQDGEFVLLQ